MSVARQNPHEFRDLKTKGYMSILITQSAALNNDMNYVKGVLRCKKNKESLQEA